MTVVRPRLVPNIAPTALQGLSSKRAWAKLYRYRLLATDTAIILLATIGAVFVRFGFDDVTSATTSGFQLEYVYLSLVIAATWLFTLSVYHTRDARVVGMGVSEYRRVVSASAITFGVLAIFFLVAKVDIARGYFIVALPVGMTGVLFSRWLWRHWLIR